MSLLSIPYLHRIKNVVGFTPINLFASSSHLIDSPLRRPRVNCGKSSVGARKVRIQSGKALSMCSNGYEFEDILKKACTY